MNRVRGIVCCASLIVALAPLAAFADTSSDHAQAELANAQAQFTDAQQTVSDLQAQAQQDASNERMIALLKSEAMRQRQLDMTNNATALEQIASELAAADRDAGTQNAVNDLLIAQNQASIVLANVDANVANARMLAITKGRDDELRNALAQADIAHRIADFITGQQAQMNEANAEQIAGQQASTVQGQANVQAQNNTALGANELLAADVTLQAAQLNATSVTITANSKASNVLGHATASLANARAHVE